MCSWVFFADNGCSREWFESSEHCTPNRRVCLLRPTPFVECLRIDDRCHMDLKAQPKTHRVFRKQRTPNRSLLFNERWKIKATICCLNSFSTLTPTSKLFTLKLGMSWTFMFDAWSQPGSLLRVQASCKPHAMGFANVKLPKKKQDGESFDSPCGHFVCAAWLPKRQTCWRLEGKASVVIFDECGHLYPPYGRFVATRCASTSPASVMAWDVGGSRWDFCEAPKRNKGLGPWFGKKKRTTPFGTVDAKNWRDYHLGLGVVGDTPKQYTTQSVLDHNLKSANWSTSVKGRALRWKRVQVQY